MAITIIKFNKSLSLIDSEEVEVSEAMTIDHFADVIKTDEGEIEFVISGTNCQIPEIEDLDFCVVIREKVDMTAQGPNDVMIKDREQDSGNKDFKDHKPSVPVDLPPGFVELKGKE